MNNSSSEKEKEKVFGRGTQVEVSSDEEGFRGAWYVATVVKHSESKDKMLVEYDSLLSDEKGVPLRESVDVKYVRPTPPLDKPGLKFRVNDVVDAYYQDGWWSGVITQVINNSSRGKEEEYKVLFSNPAHEIVFASSQLRLHRSWLHGTWLLPLPQSTTPHFHFTPGTAVEVNIELDNSTDVWFPAKLVRQVSNTFFLVEYQTSPHSPLLSVGVDSVHIRPSPPPTPTNTSFSLLEKVDAFFDGRWLTGIVTKILADGRYIVYFKRTRREKELSHSDLRLHLEWTNGNWLHSSQDTSLTSTCEKLSSPPNGGNTNKICASSEDSVLMKEYDDQVRISEAASRHHETDTQRIEKGDYISLSPNSKIKNRPNANGDAVSLRHSRGSRGESASDAMLSPEACIIDLNQSEISDSGASVHLDTTTPDHHGKSNLNQSEDNNQPSDSTDIKGDYEKHPVTRKRGRPPKLRALVAESVVDETPTGSDSVKPIAAHGPIVIGLMHCDKLVDLAKNSRLRKKATDDEGKQLVGSPDHESVKEDEVSNLKRKRGRPAKVLQLSSLNTTEAVADGVGSKRQIVSAEGFPESVPLTNEVEKPISVVEPLQICNAATPSSDPPIECVKIISDRFKRVRSNFSKSKRSTARRQMGKHRTIQIAAAVEIVEPDTSTVRRRKKSKPVKHAKFPTEDALDNSSGEAVDVDTVVADNGVGRDIDTVVALTSSNGSADDQPLSDRIEGGDSPPATDARVSMAGTAGQLDENGEKRDEYETLPCGQSKENLQVERHGTSAGNSSLDNDATKGHNEMPPIHSNATMPEDDQELPFVKSSLVWETIESMQVLKRIPQKPHFRPLYKCKEECREGFAIGSMVTFTSLAEKISRARINDPKSVLDGYLEALVDLEELGFDVIPLRDVLHKLVSIKNRCDEAQNTSKEMESQMTERKQEKANVEDEIAELEKKIKELEEKRSVAVSMKEGKDAEITLLQTKVDAVKAGLGSAKEEFGNVAASL
ncbi:hypothetical protein RND81_07G007500 [Saponaria officinalis]